MLSHFPRHCDGALRFITALKKFADRERFGNRSWAMRAVLLQDLPTNRAALDLISEAIKLAGYKLGTEIALALDVASTEFYDEATSSYNFEGAKKTASEMVAYYAELLENYPLVSIEDPLAEDDWAGWASITKELGEKSSAWWETICM